MFYIYIPFSNLLAILHIVHTEKIKDMNWIKPVLTKT